MSRALNSEPAGWAATALVVFQRTINETDIKAALASSDSEVRS